MTMAFLHNLVLPVALATCGLAALPAAQAQTIAATGFEAPDYTAGQALSGQNGWSDDGFSPGTFFVTTSHPSSGNQAIIVDGAAMTYYDFAGLYVGHADPGVTVDGNTYTVVDISVDARLGGPQTGPPIEGDDFSANLSVYNDDPNGEGVLGDMEMSSDGHVYSDTSDTSYQFARPIILGQYYTLEMSLDLTTLTTRYFLDGQYLGSLAMPSSAATDKTLFPVLSAYGLADGMGYDHSSYTASFDNFSVTAAPEPSAFAVLSLGAMGLGLLMFKAKRRLLGSVPFTAKGM